MRTHLSCLNITPLLQSGKASGLLSKQDLFPKHPNIFYCSTRNLSQKRTKGNLSKGLKGKWYKLSSQWRFTCVNKLKQDNTELPVLSPCKCINNKSTFLDIYRSIGICVQHYSEAVTQSSNSLRQSIRWTLKVLQAVNYKERAKPLILQVSQLMLCIRNEAIHFHPWRYTEAAVLG